MQRWRAGALHYHHPHAALTKLNKERKKDVETTFKEIIPEGGEKKEKELICPTKSEDWNNKLMNKRKFKFGQ